MIAYAALPFGTGAITHEDQELHGLKFAYYPGNIMAVTGTTQAALDYWAARVPTTFITQSAAQAAVNAAYIGAVGPQGQILTAPTV